MDTLQRVSKFVKPKHASSISGRGRRSLSKARLAFERRPTLSEIALVIRQRHHRDLEDMMVYLPPCSFCGRVIEDLERGNLVFKLDEDETLSPVGKVDGDPLLRQSGQSFFTCFDCDPGWTPWVRLSSIFRSDQRRRVEARVVALGT